MPRKPAASAYILATAIRDIWSWNQKRMETLRHTNGLMTQMNKRFEEVGISSKLPLTPEDDTLFFSAVVDYLEGMKDITEGIAIIPDPDYRAIIFDAVKQPYNKVRQSKGFAKLVPVFTTIRRYGPYDKNQPMDMSEEEARDLADLIWQQEMQPFVDAGRGVDPINKQIIANKVAAELKQSNVKYLGEQILDCQFDDVELDLYEYDHKEALSLLRTGIEAAYELFDYSPDNTDSRNYTQVRRAVLMYDSMLDKLRDEDRLEVLVDSIICAFKYFQQLIE